jgi:cobyrinic acid a,c-diamide synthase
MAHITDKICIAALKGGSGKTVLSVALISAWHTEGLSVAAFKKGPDFIDAGWHSFAAGAPCRNLDSFMMSADQIRESFHSHAARSDIAIVEGNRGLYDGLDAQGRCSTAELAKLLNLPVILIVDVTMVTRTVAAIIKGCQIFDPDLEIKGIILNRVAGTRQENLIRKAVESYCATPVVGAVPKLGNDPFPERHMGLVPHQEQRHALKAIRWAAEIALKYLDLTAIRKIAAGNAFQPAPACNPTDTGSKTAMKTSSISRPGALADPGGTGAAESAVRIGVIRDSVFWFYYPENLEALTRAGADLIELNSLEDTSLPPLDAIYIGGGFPETQPDLLSSNTGFLKSLKDAASDGLPVYAECGGFMYLGESLCLDDCRYPMVGVFPVDFVLGKKPRGHGYTVLETTGRNPYFNHGSIIKGHEFHYSDPIVTCRNDLTFAFKVRRGHGIDGKKDGMCHKNTLGVYTHIHAAGDSTWAAGILNAARSEKRRNRNLLPAA